MKNLYLGDILSAVNGTLIYGTENIVVNNL
jgi:hypothetical protein